MLAGDVVDEPARRGRSWVVGVDRAVLGLQRPDAGDRVLELQPVLVELDGVGSGGHRGGRSASWPGGGTGGPGHDVGPQGAVVELLDGVVAEQVGVGEGDHAGRARPGTAAASGGRPGRRWRWWPRGPAHRGRRPGTARRSGRSRPRATPASRSPWPTVAPMSASTQVATFWCRRAGSCTVALIDRRCRSGRAAPAGCCRTCPGRTPPARPARRRRGRTPRSGRAPRGLNRGATRSRSRARRPDRPGARSPARHRDAARRR